MTQSRLHLLPGCPSVVIALIALLPSLSPTVCQCRLAVGPCSRNCACAAGEAENKCHFQADPTPDTRECKCAEDLQQSREPVQSCRCSLELQVILPQTRSLIDSQQCRFHASPADITRVLLMFSPTGRYAKSFSHRTQRSSLERCIAFCRLTL